jgi:hypothetical protein
MLEILLHFGLGILGMFLYTLFKAKDYVFNQEFVLITMIHENWKTWVWSASVLLSLIVTLYLEPSLKDSIRTVFSIDLDASPGGFFMFGATINLLVKPSVKKKSTRRKKKQTEEVN